MNVNFRPRRGQNVTINNYTTDNCAVRRSWPCLASPCLALPCLAPFQRFRMKKFHHVEFYCGDATAAASRFIWGLGMSLVAKSDQVRAASLPCVRGICEMYDMCVLAH